MQSHERLVLVLLFLITVCVYLSSLRNGFVSDDRDITSHIPRLALQQMVSSPVSPVRWLVKLGVFTLFEYESWAYRLVNILLHAGNVVLVYLLLKSFATPPVRFVSSVLIAVHPIFVESVAWISGGAYPLASFFFLASLLLYTRAKNNRAYQMISIALYTLALFSLYSAFLLCIIFWAYELWFGSIRRKKGVLAVYTVLSVAYAVLLFTSGSIASRMTTIGSEYYNASPLFHPIQSIPAFLRGFLSLLVWPKNLAIFHPDIIASAGITASDAFFMLVLLSLSVMVCRRSKYLSFLLVCSVVTILPYLSPIPLSDLFTERYVYLASFGVIISIVATLHHFIRTSLKNRYISRAVAAGTALIVIALSGRTMVRIGDWKNERSLWTATVRAQPKSPNAHLNLGEVYWNDGETVRAWEEFQATIRLVPTFPDAYFNLAITLAETGIMEEAVQAYSTALLYKPDLWTSHLNLTENYTDPSRLRSILELLEQHIRARTSMVSTKSILDDLIKEKGKLH